MRIAAIDIGSNAIRFQVSTVLQVHGRLTFKKLEYIRFPLRLGQDVFTRGEISPARQTRFRKLMRAFSLLLDLYEVEDYMACATSAMREARNGRDIVRKVEQECGLKITIISGEREALLISNVIRNFLNPSKNYIHIDVGGGSTELNLYQKGVKAASKSFRIGSVRRLDHHDSPLVWKNMQKWITTHCAAMGTPEAAGTGGNITKLFELAGAATGDKISLTRIREVMKQISAMSLEERINELQLNPDRADVIVPAGEIYTRVMEWSGAKRISVPDIGLKDGLLHALYERNLDKRGPAFS